MNQKLLMVIQRPLVCCKQPFLTNAGRRKTSVANVKITPGDGLFVINGRSHLDYFSNNPVSLIKISTPLRMIDCVRQFDVDVRVQGGGTTGQAEAIVHGLSRALAKFQPEFGYLLTKCMLFCIFYIFADSMMSRDSRMVERKKPGKPKARKSFQWVKR